MAGDKHWLAEALTDPNVTVSVRSLICLRVKYLNVADAAATMLKLDDARFAELDRLNSNPLDKANAIALHCGFQKVEKGSRTGQHARLLYRMRSSLAHARAEWSDDVKTHADLSAEIVQMGLPLSPFASPADKAFPVGCMSSGVAAWAVATAENYITEYYSAARIS